MAYHSLQEINQRLERYVFGIASHFIDGADPPTQQALISAASRFITQATTDTADGCIPDEFRLRLLSQPGHQDLNQFTERRLAHRAWLANWIQQYRQYHQQHVAYLEDALLSTRQRYQSIQDTVLREPYRSKLLDRCQRSLDHFQRCLTVAHAISRSNLNQVRSLQASKSV